MYDSDCMNMNKAYGQINNVSFYLLSNIIFLSGTTTHPLRSATIWETKRQSLSFSEGGGGEGGGGPVQQPVQRIVLSTLPVQELYQT